MGLNCPSDLDCRAALERHFESYGLDLTCVEADGERSEPIPVSPCIRLRRTPHAVDAPEAADELADMITEAREEFESRTGQQLLTVTYDQFLDGFSDAF